MVWTPAGSVPAVPDAAPFRGKVAIVTGGRSGIGRALGDALTAAGATVVGADIAGDVDAHVDVRDAAAVQALVDDVVERHGRLDLLFNNAGISMGGETHELTAEHWDRAIDVNLRGVVHGVLAAYPLMVRQGSGHIVNTASGAGLSPAPFTVPYSATKHAVVGLSTGLRPEAALHGVRVSVLCPGAVETPILDAEPPPDLPVQARTLTPRQYLSLLGAKPMPADRLAAKALRGVARNQAIIAVPASTRALWYLRRLSPAAIEQVERRIAGRVQRALDPPAGGG